MNKEDFYNSLKNNLNIELSDNQKYLLAKYAELLIEYNKKVNITAIKDIEGIYLKHFYDSLTISNFTDLDNKEMLDIGSGGGFPGIVLAIVFPNLNVTSLDSNHKKTDFQKYIIDNLGLTNVIVINKRAEDYFKLNKKFDFVVARAVADMIILTELCIPFVKKDGYFIAMKGTIDNELDNALYAINFLGGKIDEVIKFNLPIINDNRALIKIKKINDSPLGYPRLYDKIIKKPLINKN